MEQDPTNRIPTLFLDIDGCLNSFKDPGQPLEPDKLHLLARIYEHTTCRIVLSSSWRDQPEKLARLRHCMELYGLVIHSHTPIMAIIYPGSNIVGAVPRFEEIQAWLDEHPETGNFVILDDELDFAHLGKHHVRTDSFTGLTFPLAVDIIGRLNTQIK